MWLFSRKGPSGFSARSTAEEVTDGIDGSGLTAIVTGGSSGIGAETARVLALRGVHVVLGVRNLAAGINVRDALIKENPSAKYDVMELDLSSIKSVKKFALDFQSKNLPLNILVNNAGVMATPFMLSQDGIELQFATNHVGHFLLTNLLLDIMKNTASRSKVEGRIVNVSSMGHMFAYREGIRFNDINLQSRYNSLFAYGQSKLANILHANELSRQLKEEGISITANSLHPGSIVTNLLRYHRFIYGVVTTLGKYILKDIPQGAATTCYVALHPEGEGITGKYFQDCNTATPSSKAQDELIAKKLWDFSEFNQVIWLWIIDLSTLCATVIFVGLFFREPFSAHVFHWALQIFSNFHWCQCFTLLTFGLRIEHWTLPFPLTR